MTRTMLPIDAAVRATMLAREQRGGVQASPTLPYVTISRQAGAGGRTLAQQLQSKLNELDRADPPWMAFDRELVEKVAQDHRISKTLVEMVEDASHSWLKDMLTGLSFSGRNEPTEIMVYRRVAATVRALAQAGRAILVGRGSVYITHDIPGGVHVRLVAPFEHRVAHMAELEGVSDHDAAERVREIDHNRQVFYKRHWPGKSQSSEAFTITLNTAQVSDDALVEAILPLVQLPVRS
ncbi:MAG: cytidylate kinase-like family protein [Phycisphaeraceae bacterium]